MSELSLSVAVGAGGAARRAGAASLGYRRCRADRGRRGGRRLAADGLGVPAGSRAGPGGRRLGPALLVAALAVVVLSLTRRVASVAEPDP